MRAASVQGQLARVKKSIRICATVIGPSLHTQDSLSLSMGTPNEFKALLARPHTHSPHPIRRPPLDHDVDGRARQRRRSHQNSHRPISSYSSLRHLFTATTFGSPRVPSYGAASPTAAANHVWLPLGYQSHPYPTLVTGIPMAMREPPLPFCGIGIGWEVGDSVTTALPPLVGEGGRGRRAVVGGEAKGEEIVTLPHLPPLLSLFLLPHRMIVSRNGRADAISRDTIILILFLFSLCVTSCHRSPSSSRILKIHYHHH
ncbi:hypothetical protein BHM03_00050328 [Ensete ventricosum]|nr:hypothetical protein BHM03_00050328 [Ensete ventricosum]